MGDVELEEAVAGGQGHLVDLGGVPGADEVSAGVGVVGERVEEVGDLVDGLAVGVREAAPLLAVDRAELAGVGVGPFVPDADAVLLEVADVGVAAEEPEQFVDDRAEVEFFGGEAGEAGVGVEVEAHLVAEDGPGAGAGAVGLVDAVVEDVLEQLEVLAHGGDCIAGAGGAGGKAVGW